MNDEVLQADPNVFTDDELNKLGLSEHPFTDHAGDIYLYSDDQLDMTSNIIMEYLTSAATTIVLTGEDGVGKTTYLRKVLRLGYQQYQFCTLRAREGITFEDVENKIKQRWIVPQSGERSVVDLSIENYVITYLREHTHAVLIVDDADTLDPSTLDRLFTLKHRIALACPSGLGLILAGDNTLKLKISELEDSNPACTQIYQINVRPLNREQTIKYIEHRLATAGLEDEVILDETQLEEIYKTSGGNIKLIHQHCIDLLKNQFKEEHTLDAALDQNITIRNTRPRIPLVLLTLVALLGFGLYVNHRQNLEKEKEVAISIPKQTEIANERALSPLAQEANTEITSRTPSLPLPKLNSNIEERLANDVAENSQVIEETIQSLDSATLKALEKDLKDVTAATIENKNQPEISSKKQDVAKADPPLTVKKVKPPIKITGEEWLKTLNDTSYTLQVVATTESSKLDELIKQEQLTRDYAYFSKPVNNTEYFVLVIGNYDTREDAVSSVNNLSESLRKNNPWPVRLDSIKKYLK